MDIDSDLAGQALEQALAQFPQFGKYGPKLEWRPLMQGGAFVVSYDEHPPRGMPNTWDLVIHFTLVVNQAILGLAPLAAKIGAIERGLSKASGGVH